MEESDVPVDNMCFASPRMDGFISFACLGHWCVMNPEPCAGHDGCRYFKNGTCESKVARMNAVFRIKRIFDEYLDSFGESAKARG